MPDVGRIRGVEMSRVHDALRRAEQGGDDARRRAGPESRGPRPGVPAGERPAGQPAAGPPEHPRGHAERCGGGALRARGAIPPAGSQQLARNAGRGVPHAAHAAEPPADPAAAAYRGGDQPFAGGRQDLHRGQPGAGAIAPGGNLGAAGRFRSAAPHRSTISSRSSARPAFRTSSPASAPFPRRCAGWKA